MNMFRMVLSVFAEGQLKSKNPTALGDRSSAEVDLHELQSIFLSNQIAEKSALCRIIGSSSLISDFLGQTGSICRKKVDFIVF